MDTTNYAISTDAGTGLRTAMLCAVGHERARRALETADSSVAEVMLAEAKSIVNHLPIKEGDPRFKASWAAEWERQCREHELFVTSADAGEWQIDELPKTWANNKSVILNGIVEGVDVLNVKDVQTIRKRRTQLKESARNKTLAEGAAAIASVNTARQDNAAPNPMDEYGFSESVSKMMSEAMKLLSQVPEKAALQVLGGEDGSQGIIGRLSHIIVQNSLDKGKNEEQEAA